MTNKLYQRDFKKIDLAMNLLNLLCNSLNQMSTLWLSHFGKPLEVSNISAVVNQRYIEKYLKTQWIENDDVLRDLVHKRKLEVNINAPENPALLEAIYSVKKYTGQMQSTIPGIVTTYRELYDGESFVVCEDFKEAVIERFSTYLSSEKDVEITNALDKVCEGLNFLNNLGCGIHIEAGFTTLGNLLDEVDTGVLNKTLVAYRGNDTYHIQNFTPSQKLFKTDLYEKMVLNLKTRGK